MDDTTDTTDTPAPPAPAAPDEAAAFAEALRLHAGGDPHGALALVRPLVERHPESLSARLLVARCAARLGAPAVALATAEEAAACDPTSWEAQVLVAQAAIPIDIEQAEAAAERAVALAPDQSAAAEVGTQVQLARTRAAEESAARRASGFGRKGARTAPEPAPTPGREPAPPAGLVGTEPTPRAERPIRLPKALQGLPAPNGTDVASTVGPMATSGVPTPVLAGLADDRSADDVPSPDGDQSPTRTGFLVVGSVTWVFLGFRYGVQVIGGPVGYVVLLLVLGLIGLFWRARLAPPRPAPDA